VRTRNGFGGLEGGGAWHDTVRGERFVRGMRDSFRREEMRQRFEDGVVIEREVNAFVGVDEGDDARGVGQLRVAPTCVCSVVARGTRSVGQFPAGDVAIA